MAVFLVNQCTFSKLPNVSNDQQTSPATAVNQNGAPSQQAASNNAAVGVGLSSSNICGLKFDSLFELIHHIEDNHINDVEYQGISGAFYNGHPQHHHHPLHPHQHHHLGAPHQQQHIQQQIYSDNQRMQNIINGHWLPTSCILRIFNSTHKPVKKEIVGGDNPIGSPATPLFQHHSQQPTPQPPPPHQQPLTPQPPTPLQQPLTPQPLQQPLTPQPLQQTLTSQPPPPPPPPLQQPLTPQPPTPLQQPLTSQPLQQPLTPQQHSSQQFPDQPPIGFIYASEAPPPYPGIGGGQGPTTAQGPYPQQPYQQPSTGYPPSSGAGYPAHQPGGYPQQPSGYPGQGNPQQPPPQQQSGTYPGQQPPGCQQQQPGYPQQQPGYPQPPPQIQTPQPQVHPQQPPAPQPQQPLPQQQLSNNQQQPSKPASTAKPFKCSECGRSYKTQKNFNIHVANQHQKDADGKSMAVEFNNSTSKT